MKKIYFITLAIVALLTSCSQSVDDTKVLVPTPGKDVNFSLNISNNATRTLYGDETLNENGEKAWVVNWADFDFVSIYGKDCSASRNQAVYYVSPHVEDEQHLNYADSLVITGEYGVQWGESATSDFYSVYPAKDNAFSIVNGKVTAQATVRTVQTNAFKSTNVDGVKIWKGQPYVIDDDNKVATMPDALMYAYTPNATNESIVNLRYVPISTVLNFTLKGWDSTLDLADPTVFVSEITLTAPNGTKIAGDCTLTFDDSGKPIVAAAANATNTITIKPTAGDNEFLPLDRGDWAVFNVFIIPSEVDANQHDLAKGDWTITLKTASGHGTHTYTLKPNNGGNAVLKSGQIHKLSVPTVNVISTFSYDPAKWIESIPRNVYLSELSMPGAWYATDSGYQGEIGIGTNNTDGIDTGLATLYKAGVRAFNIDCRLTGKPGVAIKNYGYNHHTAAIFWKYYTANDNMNYINGDDPTLILACAGTEKSPSVESTVTPSDAAIESIGLTVKDALISLGKLAEKHPNEFIEVILTISQKPKSEGRSYDAQNRYGTVSPKLMLHAISNTLNDATVKQYLYQEEITENTTVGDVLGKVVVKLNMNTTDAKFSTYGAVEVPMLISEASMASGGEGYTYSEDIVDADGQFSSMQQRAMYWADNSYTVGENTLKYYYHQAQATSGTPSMEQRKAAIKSIVQAIHNNADHNIFYQIGIGGTDQTTVANALGEYVYAALQAKLNSGTWEGLKLEPSPLGAVLMNYVTTNQYSKDLTKGIIDMNGKFELLKDEDKPKWPGAEGEGDETEGM